MSRHVSLLTLLAALASSACSSPPGTSDSTDGGSGAAGETGSLMGQVQLGVPGGPDALDFTPLADGMVLRLETFGQGGTHVLLGVRCIGFGSRAFVSLRARNLVDGTELVAPAPAHAQLLFCDGEACDLVPITMMMGGITNSNAERDGLAVRISAEVHNQAGVIGEASAEATLSTEDL